MPRRYTDRMLAELRNKMGENIPIPKERKKPSREESIMQCSLISWWAVAHKSFGVPEVLLFSIPNGGFRTAITGAFMKREGARRGSSDLFLAASMRGLHGLFLELKRPGGVLSPEQKEFLSAVSAQGYDARCCYSFDEAVTTITSYLTVK